MSSEQVPDIHRAERNSGNEHFATAYRRIAGFQYPPNIRLAVNFTIDYDAMLNRRLKQEPAMELSQGEFGGRVGVWRFLELFDRHGIRATFFTPGRIAELYPKSLREIASRGHEVANHMWEHRVPAEAELEQDHLRKATAAIAGTCGRRPVGSRSSHTPSLLIEEGYLYRSGYGDIADELPYYLLDEHGRALLNLPHNVNIDDAMYYHFSWFGSANHAQRLGDPEEVHEVFLSAFRNLYRAGTYMNICLHNFVSGRALRIALLERLIVDMKRVPGVWFATCEEVANYCLDRFPPRIP